ncbi:LAME_0D02916g1_1 [Lachancea meyersii CBS 8951]|uniref:LAME_0D02916g1_1 n=1 Tax=Lachancea meyersii CBS 8951 TaxID=1266667 RepID=A0A1G4J7F8_9SACH|nr:LAME_0D02916g1_1 [Lachancea meyersii CBS 8951]
MIHLPKSFLGVFPLYMGVEIALGITILNKCSGAYGILGLLTGHGLDVMQWLLYVSSILALGVYSQALKQVYSPQLLMFSLAVVVYSVDTVLTCFFTVWFSGQWFSSKHSEFTDPNSQTHQSDTSASQLNTRGNTQKSQSASQSAEFFFTILITVLALASRFYFNSILMAFVQRLLRHPKYIVDIDDIEQDLKNKNWFARCWIKAQHISYKWCRQNLA